MARLSEESVHTLESRMLVHVVGDEQHPADIAVALNREILNVRQRRLFESYASEIINPVCGAGT
jgi:hypothetical protein